MKKHFFLFLFFLLLTVNTYALSLQVSINQKDSLNYYYTLAIKPITPEDFTKAFDYFLKHKADCLAKNDKEGAVYDLRLLAIIQNESGFLYDAEKSCVEALKLLEVASNNKFNNDSKIGLYNQLGRIKKALKDFDAALKYYDLALKLDTNYEEKSSILNNMAFIYIEKDELNIALQFLDEAYQLALESKNTGKIATTLDNLGFLKSKLNKDDGLEDMIKALEYRIDNNLIKGQFASYNHLAQYYSTRGEDKKANLYLQNANKIANTINSKSYKLESLKQAILNSSDTIAKSYVDLKEEIENRNLVIENKYAARKYNYELQEVTALENKKDKQLFQIILLATLIIGFLAYFLIRCKHTKSKLKDVYETEFRISKRVHDEVANDLFQVMTKLGHKTETQDELINELHSLYYKTRDISKEHDLIQTNYPFIDYLSELFESFNNEDTSIIVKGSSTISWGTVSEIKRITIYKVLQELLINMKKHSQASLVVFMFNKDHKTIRISYSDNGVGATLKKNTGLHNTENRIKAINGTIIFETEPTKGFKTKITI